MPEMSLQKQIARMLPPGQGFILVTFEFDGVSVPNIYTNTEWDSAYYALKQLLETRFEEEQAEGTNGA